MKEYYSNDKIDRQKQFLSHSAKPEALPFTESFTKSSQMCKLLNMFLDLTSKYLRGAEEVDQFNSFK